MPGKEARPYFIRFPEVNIGRNRDPFPKRMPNLYQNYKLLQGISEQPAV
jgi:hypothetical protein